MYKLPQLNQNIMQFKTTLFFALLACTCINCHTNGSKMTKSQSTEPKSISGKENFPKGWIGTWHGTLEIFSAKGTQSVPMWVEIAPLDTSKQGRYQFGLVYGSKEKDNRPYELVPIDTAKGIWAVDEKNEIVMEGYLRGPKYLTWFVVQNNRVLCTYELKDAETMLFEVIGGRETAVSVTGDTILAGNDTIPEVKTYPIGVFQRAQLKRQTAPKK
jgi:hypothetical protein